MPNKRIPKHEDKISFATYLLGANKINNPWGPSDVDKMDVLDYKDFRKIVSACRFFYKRDPIAATVVNKMVDIAITDLWFSQRDVDKNQFKVFLSMKDKLRDFAENMALEYLLSGLVVPEVSYGAANKEVLQQYGIKKYEALTLPLSMWLRDPFTMKIKSSWSTERPSYFVTIPQEVLNFITSGGQFGDGTKDVKALDELKKEFPEFVAAVKRNEKEVLLDNDLIFRRRFTSESPYPIPYMYSALESMKHKRNLRRMDYSVAARVIKAIQVFKLGNDNFPITADDTSSFDDLKSQMTWRDSGGLDIENVFQLFGNHTLEVEWVFPPLEALLSDAKYREVNGDIIMGLGFPSILLTGESEKSNTSSPDFAVLSPIKTMNNMRDRIIRVLNNIITEVADQNNFKKAPYVSFKPINLQSFKDLITATQMLSDSRAISKQTLAEAFGYDWKEEHEKIIEEDKAMKDAGTSPVTPKPYSSLPQQSNNQDNTQNKPNSRKQDNKTQTG